MKKPINTTLNAIREHSPGESLLLKNLFKTMSGACPSKAIIAELRAAADAVAVAVADAVAADAAVDVACCRADDDEEDIFAAAWAAAHAAVAVYVKKKILAELLIKYFG